MMSPPPPPSSLLRSLCPDVDWAGDPDRVRFLLSPFRSRELNPESWEEKDRFWRGTVERRLRMRGGPVVLSESTLRAELSLEEDGSSPHGLGEVLQRMVAAGAGGQDAALSTLQEVREELGLLEGGSYWLWRSFTSVAGMVANKIWPKHQDEDRKYVSRARMEERAQEILAVARKGAEEARDPLLIAGCFFLPLDETLADDRIGEGLEEEEAEICLGRLRQQGRMRVRRVNGRDYLKVSSGKGPVHKFTDCEAAAVHLYELYQKLEEGMEAKEERRVKLRSQLKLALGAAERDRARHLLAQERRLRTDLERRRRVLSNLDSMLSSLASAEEDAEVLASFKAGADTLKSSLAGRAEEAEEVAGRAKDAVEESREISALIAEAAFVRDDDEDEDELEKELEELVRQCQVSEAGEEAIAGEVEEKLHIAGDEVEDRKVEKRPSKKVPVAM